MRSISSLWTLEDKRRSRFHTWRGEFASLRALTTLAPSVAKRLTGRTVDGPWIVPSAVRFLRRRLRGDDVVLEVGAGQSTPWLAARCRQLISFEHDPTWHRSVLNTLRRSPHGSVDLRLVPLHRFETEIDELETVFDLVFVDSEGDRASHLRSALRKVREGGLLVLDDSDRSGLDVAALQDWQVTRFHGFRPRPLQLTETTVFTRPVRAPAPREHEHKV
jgi:predicted O-methyltransferase YrrM